MSLPKFPDAQTRHQKLVYVKNNWQLYVFFAMPAVLLTLIFKYVPMGGLAIAFEDYNNRLGIFGSEWIWFENFQRFLSSTEFPRLMMNTLKLSVYGLLWGFFPPIILAILLSRVRRVGLRKKNSAADLCAQLHFGDRNGRYDHCLPFSGRPHQCGAGYAVQPDDRPGSIPFHLHHQRNLAGRRLGVHHLHSGPVRCERGSDRRLQH